MSRRLIVFGAGRPVGSAVVRRARRAGDQVTGVVAPERPSWHLDEEQGERIALDPLEVPPRELCDLLEGHGAVIDCWNRGGWERGGGRERVRRTVGRLRRLFDACRRTGVARVVYLSDAASLGDGRGAEVGERDRYVPGRSASARVEAVARAEAEIYRYVRSGLSVVVAVPGWMIGPGEVPVRRTAPLMLAATGRWPFVWEERLSVVDARDVADGLFAAIDSGRRGRRYVLAGFDADFASLVRGAARVAGVAPPQRRVPAGLVRGAGRAVRPGLERVDWPLGEVVDALRTTPCIEGERAEGELGWQARPREASVRETVDWLLEHRDRVEKTAGWAPRLASAVRG